jgi:hypothetical protein
MAHAGRRRRAGHEPASGDAVAAVAGAIVPFPPADVFAFLAELRNHWQLTGRFVALEEVEESGPAAEGGWIRVRGPLGISRLAHTRLVRSTPPSDGVGGVLEGRAEVPNGTSARIDWMLSAAPGGTRVSLRIVIEKATLTDRLLLVLGGRRWLESVLLRSALENLEQALADQRR